MRSWGCTDASAEGAGVRGSEELGWGALVPLGGFHPTPLQRAKASLSFLSWVSDEVVPVCNDGIWQKVKLTPIAH